MRFWKDTDGNEFATVNIQFHVPRSMYDWLSERIGKREAAIEIRSLFQQDGMGADWRTFAVKDGEPTNIHVDDIDSYLEDEYEVFRS